MKFKIKELMPLARHFVNCPHLTMLGSSDFENVVCRIS